MQIGLSEAKLILLRSRYDGKRRNRTTVSYNRSKQKNLISNFFQHYQCAVSNIVSFYTLTLYFCLQKSIEQAIPEIKLFSVFCSIFCFLCALKRFNFAARVNSRSCLIISKIDLIISCMMLSMAEINRSVIESIFVRLLEICQMYSLFKIKAIELR